ncbi:hypothetical protein B0H10DRAFT_1859275 [Mycena sp. CBHHK59/15]|nr:hypothetical protein B0H10DRAFT_1859275 [Mycena sp. CBHHK59/15]
MGAKETVPSGFLFLCPLTDFQSVDSNHFRIPDCAAYWSLDPSGVERLGMEEAEKLGFPSIELDIRVEGHSWDANIYAGLRQFHSGKGFEPDSQDLTRHLGYPFFQLSREFTPPFAHGE